jgi:hypothetical protein
MLSSATSPEKRRKTPREEVTDEMMHCDLCGHTLKEVEMEQRIYMYPDINTMMIFPFSAVIETSCPFMAEFTTNMYSSFWREMGRYVRFKYAIKTDRNRYHPTLFDRLIPLLRDAEPAPSASPRPPAP